jgi:hypothetical protein
LSAQVPLVVVFGYKQKTQKKRSKKLAWRRVIPTARNPGLS